MRSLPTHLQHTCRQTHRIYISAPGHPASMPLRALYELKLMTGRTRGGRYLLCGNEEGSLVLPIPISAPSLGRESQQQCYHSSQDSPAHPGALQCSSGCQATHINGVCWRCSVCRLPIIICLGQIAGLHLVQAVGAPLKGSVAFPFHQLVLKTMEPRILNLWNSRLFA